MFQMHYVVWPDNCCWLTIVLWPHNIIIIDKGLGGITRGNYYLDFVVVSGITRGNYYLDFVILSVIWGCDCEVRVMQLVGTVKCPFSALS
jgi:hypothetical protein